MLFTGDNCTPIHKAVIYALHHGRAAVQINGKSVAYVQGRTHYYAAQRSAKVRTRSKGNILFIQRRTNEKGDN